MKSSRRTQPYRRGKARSAGPTLEAILSGKTAAGTHPSTSSRRLRKLRGVQNYGTLKPFKPFKPYKPGHLAKPTPMHPGFTLPGEQHQPLRARRKSRS